MQLLAKTLYGLEHVLADELQALGAQHVERLNRAVRFHGDRALIYKANLWCRTALRILLPVHSYTARHKNQLYNGVRRYNWQELLKSSDTLAVDTTLQNTYFSHSKFVSQKIKDAVVDQIREREGKRPSVDLDQPTLRLNAHIYKNKVSLSIDTSGNSLHRRGYHVHSAAAPLNEVLGAGMIRLADWQGKSPLLDPMCGSGTIVTEATMIAANIAPGLNRSFGFETLNDFDHELWQTIKQEAKDAQQEPTALIQGSDQSARAIRSARINLQTAGVDQHVTLQICSLDKLKPPVDQQGVIITNPPYGERLGKDDLPGFYQTIGDKLKRSFPGWDAWLLSANPVAIKRIGLQTQNKFTLYNGQLECKYLHYPLYQGSKKKKYAAQ